MVYQGIPGQIAGLHLSKVYLVPPSQITLDDLTKVAQDRVKQGISADSAADAQRKLQELMDPANGNVVCPSSSASASAGASASASESLGTGSPVSPRPGVSGTRPPSPGGSQVPSSPVSSSEATGTAGPTGCR